MLNLKKTKNSKKAIKQFFERINHQKKTFLKRVKKINRKTIIFAATIAAVLTLVYLAKAWLVAAFVNGQPITRVALIKQLEERIGRETLETLINEKLILQEADKQGVVVTTEEVDSSIQELENELEKQGQSLDQLLLFQNLTRPQLASQIKIQKLIEKLLEGKTPVSDEEITEYIETNQDFVSKEAESGELKEGVRKQLQQQKLAESFETWMQDLRTKAKINYFVRFP